MNKLAILALATLAFGCAPTEEVGAAATNANPLASADAPATAKPAVSPVASTAVDDHAGHDHAPGEGHGEPAASPAMPGKSPELTEPAETEKPAEPEKPAGPEPTVASLVNPDGKIDKGLPKSAAPGAKLPKRGDDIAIVQTGKGTFVLRFFPGKAPKHVANFLKLSRSGFYNGTRFHRVIPGFMIQGGDPNTKGNNRRTWGMGGPGTSVPAEFNDVPHTRGILSMARSQDPDSAGSQFFVCHDRAASLDNQYTVFGHVIKGIDVVDKIVSVPTDGDQAKDPVKIVKVTLAKWPVKL